MTNQIAKIIEKQKELSLYGEYIVVFANGTVSEVLTQGSVPCPEEGEFVSIFENDTVSSIESKLGSLLENN